MTKFQEGQKVELIAGKEEVYPRALAHSRGLVTRTKVDDDGFDQVYIVWDREHWRYNGEQDGWTYADHFRAVDDEILSTAEEFDVPVVIPTETDEELVAQYLEVLMAACDRASESDAFFFVSLKRNEQGQTYYEVMGASIDEELMELPMSDIFHFIEGEMRRREL